MIKLHFRINGCWACVEADRFEILKLESQKSDPLSTGLFMAYMVNPLNDCIVSILFCCSSSDISEVVDDEGFPYQVKTVFI